MALKPRPPAEVTLDAFGVRALLEAQQPDLAGLPLNEVASGWDNFVFRLGDDLAVRLPRRAIAAPLIEREARWLPELAPSLPLAVPVPVRVGRPSNAFPWAWSVVRWLPGEPASVAPPANAEATAVVLGPFLRALHRAAPPHATRSAWRGTPLAERTASVHAHLTQLTRAWMIGGFVRPGRCSSSGRHGTARHCWYGDLHPRICWSTTGG